MKQRKALAYQTFVTLIKCFIQFSKSQIYDFFIVLYSTPNPGYHHRRWTNLFSLYLDISSATINFVKLWIIIAKIKLHKIVLSTSTNLLPAKTLASLLRLRGQGEIKTKVNFRCFEPFCELSRGCSF